MQPTATIEVTEDELMTIIKALAHYASDRPTPVRKDLVELIRNLTLQHCKQPV